jgi:ribonuclease HI
LFFDGSLQLQGAGAGAVIISPDHKQMKYVLRLHFRASNNAAEYEALLHGLQVAITLGITRLTVSGESALVINQVTKEWMYSDDTMLAYCSEVRKMESKFDGLEYRHILRKFNDAADELAKIASSRAPVPDGVFSEDLHSPIVQIRVTTPPLGPAEPVLAVVPDWRVPFVDYLLHDRLPPDPVDARPLTQRAKNYLMVDQQLYRRSPSGILMKCITEDEGLQLMSEIHAGICGHHPGARMLVGKAYRQGFFWPTARDDADSVVRTYENCQFFARQIHVPATELQMIPAAWPFSTWGLDSVGPLRKAPGGFDHIFVAIDKFSKWIEAKPVGKITSRKATFQTHGTLTSYVFFMHNYCKFDNNVRYVLISHYQCNTNPGGYIILGLHNPFLYYGFVDR